MNRALENHHIAELLALEAETSTYPLDRAFKKASRSAFLWPVEAAEIIEDDGALTQLDGVGPFIGKRIREWIEKPPNMPPKQDELRRDFLTMSKARSLLRKNQSWKKSLRGDLQMHTIGSDGSGTCADMATAGIECGYEYIAITDHSKGLKIANGMNEVQLEAQGKEIAAANAANEGKITVLHSIEMNINPHGEGDMDSAALAKLDIVLGSFHSALRRSEDQTPRYLAALRNPDIQILGHPKGRIYNYRLGLKADWDRVFAEAAKLDKAVEIDAYPDRQDLSVELLKKARKAGVRISMGTDSHHPEQLYFMDLGMAAALIAKIPAERIINFLPLPKLQRWISSVRVEE